MNPQGPTTPQRLNSYPILTPQQQQQQQAIMVGVPQPQQQASTQQQQQQQPLNRPLQQNPNNAAVFNNNRSYSPHTPSNMQPQQIIQQHQIARTPIQLMQQQTQAISNTQQQTSQMLNSPSASGAIMVNANTPDLMRKRQQQQQHGSNMSTNSPHSASVTHSALMASQQQQQQQHMEALSRTQNRIIRKKAKLKDKIIPQKVRDLVPDSQSYMDLLAFERKLDATIMRKRLDIQEALKRPIKIKKKLRVFITNQYYPGKQSSLQHQDNDNNNDEDCVPQWELKIEGRILDTDSVSSTANPTPPQTTVKLKPKKFSSFFKSLVIELDKDLYGPDNHLVEWHRTAQTAETDGFQVKRHGDQTLKCTILMLLDYQPPQFKLDPRLAKLLSIHTATRPVIIQSLWQYIKVHKLQDNQEKEFINLDKYLQQIFDCERIRFSDIPNKLNMHCMPPDPIVINHMINIESNEPKRMSIYDIDVDVDDPIRDQMKNFLTASQNQSLAEVAQLDSKIHEQIEQINQLRLSREFFMSFSEDPQDFINKWLVSQSNDIKSMLDLNGNPEEERRAQFYHESWTDEAVCRYFYNKVQQRRAELEQVLGIRN